MTYPSHNSPTNSTDEPFFLVSTTSLDEAFEGKGSRPNRLLRNNGDGTFSAGTGAGLDLQFDSILTEDFRTPGAFAGMLSADFNGNGWPDLFMAVHGPNRLFLNDGQGLFVDATTSEIGDAGVTFNASAGGIDNDGNLDFFVSGDHFQSGDQGTVEGVVANRSLMLLNLGDAQFLDVAEAVGLGLEIVGIVTIGPAFSDIDNDGDLDLIVGASFSADAPRSLLLLNDGSGVFSDAGISSGFADSGWIVGGILSLGDYDEDGFVDIASDSPFRADPGPTALYRNNGNGNHWLRVELVGVQTNRSAIGTQVFATAGDLTQMREILGGTGRSQDEKVAHFGLGERTQVDRLEIRWPSGQVDELTDIPADQKIRVIEGRGEHYPSPQTVWTTPPPESVTFGETIDFTATARPALFEPTATVTSITGDLSSLGGSSDLPLTDNGDGTYTLEATFEVGGESESRDVEVFILQETSLGEHWINLSRNIEVINDPTAVLEDYTADVPEAFSLEQNYPNPFNSGTVIPLTLPTSAEVTVKVYNLAGQKVATLLDGYRDAGSYALNWDGRDDAGHELASGVYLYRFRAGTQTETRRLLILR